MARLVRAATDRNPPTLGGGGCQQGITPWDMQTLANVASRGYNPLQQEVYDRAHQSALVRVMQGFSPFWMSSDGTPGTMRSGAAYQQILK